MNLPDAVLWTLHRLERAQASNLYIPFQPDPRHLEALEAAGYISVKAKPGGWHVLVFEEGSKVAAGYRKRKVEECSREFAKS